MSGGKLLRAAAALLLSVLTVAAHAGECAPLRFGPEFVAFGQQHVHRPARREKPSEHLPVEIRQRMPRIHDEQ